MPKNIETTPTIALISHASKMMLKILQTSLQQYVNWEITDVQAIFRKGRGIRDQIANICWIIEKAREFHKNIYFWFTDCAKSLCGSHSQSYGFASSHVWIWEMDDKESWAPKNWCFWTMVLEKTLESPLDCKDIKPSILKKISAEYSLEGLMWSWSSNILATWCEELTHWKRPWCWERLKAGGEMDNKGWDDWMALLTQRTWVWASSGVGDGQGSLTCYSHRAAKSQTWLRDWTEQNVDQNKLQKILKEMGIADYRNCLLRTCMQVKSNS